jgi:dephospho-CoA kinase
MFLDIKMQSEISNQDEIRKTEIKIIGLTGGIGAGKTMAAKFIEEMGFPVYYSDVRAKEIVNENEFLKNKIKKLLGNEAYDENGFYDRKWVAGKVFENAELLEKLNKTIHPAVKIDFENWILRQNSPYLFKETALLFELNLNESCYKTLLITAEDNIRMKRVMNRDEKTYREAEYIMQKQMPEKDKIKLADFVIYNNETLGDLKENTGKILQKILVS